MPLKFREQLHQSSHLDGFNHSSAASISARKKTRSPPSLAVAKLSPTFERDGVLANLDSDRLRKITAEVWFSTGSTNNRSCVTHDQSFQTNMDHLRCHFSCPNVGP